MILFTHIAKTAGRTLSAAFLNAYGPRAITVDGPGVLKNAIRDRGETWRLNLEFAGGHMTRTEIASILDVELRDHFAVALLRDPVRRVISFYLFILRNDVPPMEFLRKPIVGRDLEYFVDFSAERMPDLIVNTQARYLSGEDSSAAGAIAAIKSDYALVADVSRFGDLYMLTRAASQNGIPEWSPAASLNVAPLATTAADIQRGHRPDELADIAPAHVIRKIEALSEADLEVREFLAREHDNFYRRDATSPAP